MKRYSSGILLSTDMSNVLLIHKLTPANLANKANFPGGKVDDIDYCSASYAARACDMTLDENIDLAHIRCCAREIKEETGLNVSAQELQFVCALRFNFADEDAECRFYCADLDISQAVTKTQEHVFISRVIDVLLGNAVSYDDVVLHPMGNLAWLCAMAHQVIKRSHESVYTVTALDKHV